MIFGDSCSRGSGNVFEIGPNSMWALLIGKETGLECSHTQLLPHQNICSTLW